MNTEGYQSLRRSILIAIPTLNEGKTIANVIGSLLEGIPDHLDITLVVADGGSNDETVDLVRRIGENRPEVRLIHNPARIQSAAVNAVAREYGNDIDVLVRCDAHAVYSQQFIPRLLTTLERTGADAVVVPMDSTGTTCLQKAIAWVSDTAFGSGGSAHRGGRRSGFIDHGHHAAFRMESFRRAGGYDESFTHNEDAELDCRQRALGSRIYLDADIRLGYHPRATLTSLWRQYFNYGKGRARTVRKHPSSLRLRQFAVPVFWCANLAALVIGWWQPWTFVLPAAYALGATFTSCQMAARHRSSCGLWAGPAAMTMHASWAAGFVWSWISRREPPWSGASATPLAFGTRRP